jgi:hypothetical protein
MPLPLAPLLPIALRLGAVAAAGWAVRRALKPAAATGRTDQRAEDALDDLDEGFALHHPQDRTSAQQSQTNAAGRLVRTLRWRAQGIEIDAGFLARLRVRKV